MVEEFRTVTDRGTSEVVSPGFKERTVAAGENPAAGAEQSSAITPTAEPSRPGGQGGLPDLLVWGVAIALLAVSVVLPAVMGGGWMWLLTAVMVPLLAAWMVIPRLLRTRGPHLGRGALGTVVVLPPPPWPASVRSSRWAFSTERRG